MSTINFKGKSLIQNHHLTVKHHQLIPKKDKSLTKKVSLEDNLIIHGDNLKALKALLPTYTNKVKCIYIDPPYNTGNEKWVYNDNVSHPMFKDWLGKIVDNEDMTRHDKWLCMMTPRLKLLRELLRDDGVIFISIDDNEQHRLRELMDEIFGEENYLTTITWRRKKESANDNKGFSLKGEYILIYTKSDNTKAKPLPLDKDYIKNSYTKPNTEYPLGMWRPVPISVTKGHQGGGYEYTIQTPDGKRIKRKWLYPEKSYIKLLKNNRIYFGKNGHGIPQRVIYSFESQGVPPSNLWLNIATNKDGKKEIFEILTKDLFDTPKPTKLIIQLLKIFSDKQSIVLDSFAGSGTTAHAVLQLNKEDGGNRKFILVEMEDYADKITAERVRRVIKGVPKAKDDDLKNGLGGSFSYFELGDPIEMESILSGKNLPSFKELARYVFYTATGEEFDESKLDEKRQFIGESKTHEVFLFYKPDLEYLRNTALTLDKAKALGKLNGKRRLVFAPTKYLDQNYLDQYQIDFAQLPFEIYKLKG
jgi:adenine-specific DNA-methyltransferase